MGNPAVVGAVATILVLFLEKLLTRALRASEAGRNDATAAAEIQRAAVALLKPLKQELASTQRDMAKVMRSNSQLLAANKRLEASNRLLLKRVAKLQATNERLTLQISALKEARNA